MARQPSNRSQRSCGHTQSTVASASAEPVGPVIDTLVRIESVTERRVLAQTGLAGDRIELDVWQIANTDWDGARSASREGLS